MRAAFRRRLTGRARSRRGHDGEGQLCDDERAPQPLPTGRRAGSGVPSWERLLHVAGAGTAGPQAGEAERHAPVARSSAKRGEDLRVERRIGSSGRGSREEEDSDDERVHLRG
jgi:hypothetical protein